MSEQKKSSVSFGRRTVEIKGYVETYLQSLKKLKGTLPEHYLVTELEDIASVGKAEVWPCIDGHVALIYKDPDEEVKVLVKGKLPKTVGEYMKTHKVYNNFGAVLPETMGLNFISTDQKAYFHFSGFTIITDRGEVFRSLFQRGFAAELQASLGEPDKQALADFQAAYITRNIGGKEAEDLDQPSAKAFTAEKGKKLIGDFYALLNNSDSSKYENPAQRFLNDNPGLLFPEYVECRPQFSLGKEYTTDFIFVIQDYDGANHVLVEIEAPDKPLFTNKGQFTAEFTEAKNQLLNWQRWIEKNTAYIHNDFPELFRPKYHLVMGRNTDLTPAYREKIRTEFAGTDRVFSTYDDVAIRFEKILNNLTMLA